MGTDTKQADYNLWHNAHSGDNDIDTPWHKFTRIALASIGLDNKIVLEIGCGRGGFSNHMLREFNNIEMLYACDYSDSALAQGKANFPPAQNIRWQKEDIQRLTFEDQTFDVIVSCETIEHVPHPMKALEEIYRALKPGGKFILTCPNYFNLFGVWCLYRVIIGSPYTEGGQPYVNYLLLPQVYAKLKGLGFKIDLFKASELVLPARVPKTFWPNGISNWLKYFGNRTYFILTK
ncbi:MAG TPA: methyltransferase domain-containing protein [Chryseolinea sp.]|nr:methyltransferase domain-containing protein [Chryseolinea sp.]